MNKLNPKKILKTLLEGNKNFVSSTPKAGSRCFQTVKSLKSKQQPGAMVLCCSDSRVTPEIIFDCGLGTLFVIRTAGSAIGPNILESIEFGVKKLEIPLLILLGHQDCGVMKYALEADLYNDEFENLIYQVQTVKNEKNITCFNDLAKIYTSVTKNRLLKKSSIIKGAADSKKLEIVRAYFSFDTGLVEVLECNNKNEQCDCCIECLDL